MKYYDHAKNLNDLMHTVLVLIFTIIVVNALISYVHTKRAALHAASYKRFSVQFIHILLKQIV